MSKPKIKEPAWLDEEVKEDYNYEIYEKNGFRVVKLTSKKKV